MSTYLLIKFVDLRM